MYEVHLEWQTRVCPVGVATLIRQFRRYFDRFEGRIREPPYAVYDDLAYTQGSPPTVIRSPTLEHDIGSAGGIMTGPNLEEYRERLRGFALDLGKPDHAMQNVFPSNEHQQHDIGDLYNFGTTIQNHTSMAPGIHFTDANQLDESVFSSLEPFSISDHHHSFQNDPQPFSGNGTQGLSPFELASIASSHHSGQPPMSEDLSLLFDETDIDMLENDLFGDMPDMPGLDGIIDQNFLDFLDTQQ
jgi:hypothetical protein